MSTILVSGGRPIRGEVRIAGAKNAAPKMMAAAVLTDEEVLLSNVPRISDIRVMMHLLSSMGVDVRWCGPHSLSIRARSVCPVRFKLDVFAKIRASFVLLAPTLARCGAASVPNPGGDRIGHRPVDRLVDGIRHFGVQLDYDGTYYNATTTGLVGCEYTFHKNSHMGTEHQILAAVTARGRSVIHNAAEEPEVDDLISMLNSMGARINRPHPRTIVVEGVPRLHGTHHEVMPDRIEAGTFATIAAATDGDLYLQGASPRHMVPLLDKLAEAGCRVEREPSAVRVRRGDRLTAVNVTTRPHPGFMTDWQAPFAVVLTQAQGVGVIHETIFPNRLGYTEQLRQMGARIELFNPSVPEHGYDWNERDDSPEYFHAARIYGPTPLSASNLTISDLRAGATMIIAALCADGTSQITGTEWVERGYEYFIDRLRALGATIEESLPAGATA